MFLIEKIDNALQLLSLIVCTVLALFKATSTHKRIWTLMSMFYAVVTLGTLYWFLYMMLYGDTPYYDFIPDLCWLAAFMYMLLVMLHIRDREWSFKDHKIFWIIPVFTTGLAIFYMQWGEYFTNIAYAILMGMILYQSIGGVITADKKDSRYNLYFVTLIFCLVEYSLWTASCFSWGGIPFLDPYYFFDIMLTAAYVLLYLATGKAADDELH